MNAKARLGLNVVYGPNSVLFVIFVVSVARPLLTKPPGQRFEQPCERDIPPFRPMAQFVDHFA